MGFFSRLRAFFAGSPPAERYLPVYLYSHRCREAVAGRIDLHNELSAVDADNAAGAAEGDAPAGAPAPGAPAGAVWFVRKVLTTSGRDRCFDNLELRLWLDAGKQVVHHEVDRGMWLEVDEYERLRLARASTLEDDSPGGGSASDMDETEKPGGNPNPR